MQPTTTPMPLISMTEKLIALGDVPSAIPRPSSKARKISRDAVYRWTRFGLAGVAPLETVYIGREQFTSQEALNRFFARVSAAKMKRTAAPPVPDPSTTASHQEADAKLQELGM